MLNCAKCNASISVNDSGHVLIPTAHVSVPLCTECFIEAFCFDDTLEEFWDIGKPCNCGYCRGRAYRPIQTRNGFYPRKAHE